MNEVADWTDLERLRALFGNDSEAAREERIRALSDAELIRAVELLSDETVIRNVSALASLRAECARRGIRSVLKH